MNCGELTTLFRTGIEPYWLKVREIAKHYGLDVNTSALAVSFEDGEFYEYGVLVSSCGQVYEFGVSYRDREFEDGEVVEWNDKTAVWENWHHSTEVRNALKYLSHEST